MLVNYITVAFRNLTRNKGYSFINVIGLAIGMTCCILILLYVRFELGYDRSLPDADRIFRIAWMNENPQTRTPHPMAQAMVRDFPEVVSAVSLSPIWGPGLTRPSITVRHGDDIFDETGVLSADSTFFEVFSFPFIYGNPKTALIEPNSLVITREIAQKYFGSEDALGETLHLDRYGDGDDFNITGVIETIPEQSHFKFDFLISYVTLKQGYTGGYYSWEDFGHYNYIRLAEGADAKVLESKIPAWVGNYLDISPEDHEDLQSGRIAFRLQPVTDIHLHSNLRWELQPNSDISTIYLLSTIALFVLILACINFVNLSTARASERVREIGLRKVLGAFRTQLIRQFLGESFLLSLVALLLAVGMVELLLPWFNTLNGTNLATDYLHDPWLLTGIAAIVLLTGALAGFYPAFYLSGFRPALAVGGTISKGDKGVLLKRTLVVAQFAIAIALIAGTGIVSSQLNLLRNKKLGFQTEQIVVVPIKDSSLRRESESIKEELKKNKNIIGATAVSNVPGKSFNQNPIQWQSPDNRMDVSEIRVDYDFFETLGIEIVEGRSFEKAFPLDTSNAFILNESAAGRFDWPSAVGQEILWDDDWGGPRVGRVIGVAQDFNFQSLHRQIEPLIFHILPDAFNDILIKVNSHDLPATIASIEKTWQTFDPNHSFEYAFLSDDFQTLYQAEDHLQKIFSWFTLLALFIACLGLFGLASYVTERRTMEIGIRRVLGASAAGIVRLLSADFVKMVLVANVLAWPVAYFSMQMWLQNFAYQSSINVWVFVLAGMTGLIIAMATVSWHAIRAAMANPVKSLRYE